MRRLKHPLIYTLAALLLLLAALFSALRLAVIYVGEYRQQVEQVASHYLGQTVRISGIDASLIGFSPGLVLEDVSLHDPASDAIVAQFSHLAITLDPLSSLRRWEPVTQVLLRGANLGLVRDREGQLSLHGMVASPAGSGGDKLLLDWLLAMHQLSILDSELHWLDEQQQSRWHFRHINLHMENRPGAHRLKGELLPPPEVGGAIELALELHGDPYRPESWVVDHYLKLTKLNTVAHRDYRHQQWQLQGGLLDLELWGQWQNDRLHSLEGALALQQLQLQHDAAPPWQLERLASRFHYRHQHGQQQLQLAELVWQQGELEGGPQQWQWQRQADGHQQLLGEHLALDSLAPFHPLLHSLVPEARQWLEQLAPSGELNDVALEWRGETLQAATAKLTGIAWEASDALPGIRGLDAQLNYHDHRAWLQLDSPALQLDLPRLFPQPLALHHSRAELLLEPEGDAWRLFAEGLQIDSPDIQAQGRGQILFEAGKSPLLSLQAEFRDGMATAVRDYLPSKVMPASGARWLEEAFLSGQATRGQMLLHGRAGDFPFRQHSGRFEVLFEAHDVTLAYDPQWPPFDQVDGRVHFINEGMWIDAHQARLFDADITQTQVSIKDFGLPLLEVDGKARSPVSDGIRLLRESPLGRDLAVLREFDYGGHSRVALQLALPLSRRVDETARYVRGQVYLTDGRLRVRRGLEFAQIHGELGFDGPRFHASGIQAQLYQQPMELDVSHSTQDQGETRIIAHGQLSPAHIAPHWPEQHWLDKLDGSTPWQGQLRIPHQGGRPTELQLNSDGIGLVSRLPAPLGKPAAQAMPIGLQLQLANGEGRQALRIGDAFALRWQSREQLERVALRFGAGDPPELPSEEAIRIRGSLEQFNPAAWLALLPQGGEVLAGRALPIDLALQRLHLQSGVRPQPLPGITTARPYRATIHADIADLRHNDMALGELSLQMRPDARQQLTIETLRLNSETFHLEGSGLWAEHHTELDLNLDSDNLGRMLEGLGFASVIRDGEARIDTSLRWPGGPLAFSLAGMEGDMKARIDEGTIEEARPGAGKLLGILSLQALPRRLMLDFRDITDTGLHFKGIRADIGFSGGNAHSRELSIDTHPAKILITGRTGLIARDFDQQMAVIPQMSDTVSVVGALAWGPQVGALLVLLQNIFKRDIDAATMQRYEITGSWEEPKIVSLTPPPLPDEPSFP